MDDLALKGYAIVVVVMLLCTAFIWTQIVRVRDGCEQKLRELQNLILQNERGVYKRIDENRELLELLIQQTPQLFETHGWIRGWFKSQDEYLLALAYRVGKETENSKRVRPYPVNIPGDQ
ncbi:hypothetical protein NT241_003294 [Salmonella enterica]|nr:hypothetical protein [Salmonella enterica]